MLRKIFYSALTYLIIGLTSGVYQREFLRFSGYNGDTQITIIHTHALTLGVFFFLILLLLEHQFQLSNHKNFKKFFIFYHIGLLITILLMTIHGTFVALGNAPHAAFSGIAGIGHIFLTIGFIYFFQVLFQSLPLNNK